MIIILLILLGLTFGSFLNVCVYRFPRGQSILGPSRSFCPHCESPIRFYDNIPLLSFLILKGKCRDCGKRISARYPLVEFLSAALWVGCWLLYSFTFPFFVSILFLSILLAITFTDLETELIPNAFTYPGFILGVMLSFLYPALHQADSSWISLAQSLLGALTGFLLVFLTRAIGYLVIKKEAMGLGDLKLLVMVGAFLGWQKTLLTFFIAPYLALPVALFILFTRNKKVLPYGPFLSIAAALELLYGEWIWRSLLSLIVR